MNIATIRGKLSKNPTLRTIPSGSNFCNLLVVTEDNRNGSVYKEFHQVVVYGHRAVECGTNLNKGDIVFIIGRLQHRSYEDKDGVKRYITEIIATEIGLQPSEKSEAEEKLYG